MSGTMRPKPRRRRAAARALAALVCISCLAAAGALAAHEFLEERAYRALSPGTDTVAGEPVSPDLPNAVAWLSVEGTDVDYPVMQPSAGEPADFYLSHTAWGTPSAAGCPYLDRRCAPDGPHLLAYGHATGFPSRMFEPLRAAYRPEVFARLGEAHWRVPAAAEPASGGTVPKPAPPQSAATAHGASPGAMAQAGTDLAFRPLCALRVDQSFAAIQRFSLNGGADVAAFAHELAQQASARSPTWEEQARCAQRILTLVTCSQATAGTRERTLVIFTLS